jgi:antitoxin VapB
MEQEEIMQTARLFANGRSQAVRLPKEYQFKGDNVYIQKVGEAVILFPVEKEWEIFLHGLNSFSGDFMSGGRLQGSPEEREEL